MIRAFTFALLLVTTGFVVADEPKAKKSDLDLSTDRLKASYGIGLSIGKQLKGDGLEVDIATLAAGLRDSLEGADAKLTQEAFGEAIANFQKDMHAKLFAKKAKEGEQNKVAGAAFLAKNKKKPGIVTLESGLQYEVLKKGKGKSPSTTDSVKAHYHGTLIDGTVFDSSVERGEPLSFRVTGVIDGWTEALQLMKEGDKWRLYVPSELAYKERSMGDDIGPHSTLIFDVELLEVE